MKKFISFIVVLILSFTAIINVNAMGTLSNSQSVILNGENIGTWKQVNLYPEVNNTIYFWARTGNSLSDGQPEQKYFQIQNGKLKEIKESDIETSNEDLDYAKIDEALEKHFKQENNDDYTTTLYIDGKDVGTFNYDYIDINYLSEKAFWYKLGKLEEGKWNDYYYLHTYYKTFEAKPSIDKQLNKAFAKIDKLGEEKANKKYNIILNKLDQLLEKTKSEKKIELIEYIKYKIEEKIK